MAKIYPNIHHLSTTQGHADFPSRWIQTDHIQRLAGFAMLTTLNLDSVTFLRQQELHQLQNLKCLSALSLPHAELEREQTHSLVNSKQLTQLHVGRSCLQTFFHQHAWDPLHWLQCSMYISHPVLDTHQQFEGSRQVCDSLEKLSFVPSILLSLEVDGNHEVWGKCCCHTPISKMLS
ncbi:TPA: hypothetical protein ACH3X1_007903 [Trebouxia sp. C0004]